MLIDKPKYKTKKQVQTELRKNKWNNDTLSPLSVKKFWDIANDLVPEDEICKSALMSKSFASSIALKYYFLVATENKLYISVATGEHRFKNKVLDLENIESIKLSEDLLLKSRVYVKIKISWYKKIYLESADPTSSVHFKVYLDKMNRKNIVLQKKLKDAQSIQLETENSEN